VISRAGLAAWGFPRSDAIRFSFQGREDRYTEGVRGDRRQLAIQGIRGVRDSVYVASESVLAWQSYKAVQAAERTVDAFSDPETLHVGRIRLRHLRYPPRWP
jgi:hypothetical protein